MWIAGCAGLAMGGGWWLTRQPALPDAAMGGSGGLVTIVLFADDGRRLRMVQLRQVIKPVSVWQSQLSPEAFAVTRRQATEFAFHNEYWNNHGDGLYRCVCCGSGVFRSADKFDSGTGWPSFTAPAAEENIVLRPDRSLGLERTEVTCRKCMAHLGHVFPDGPPPTHQRYCLNSAALRFVPVK